MALPAPRVLPLGDAALTVEFGQAIDPTIHALVLGFCAALDTQAQAGQLDGVVEWAPAFRSVSVYFDPQRMDAAALAERLQKLAETRPSAQPGGRRWRIPVCFDADLAPDLDAAAEASGLGREGVIQLLTRTSFTVYMLGFLPGFPYLGGLPAALALPRLATPRSLVPARSLAVAAGMCAVYPWASPGGWRLLGRTPIPLFDPSWTPSPALLAAGDTLRWQAVERARFDALEADCAAGRFDPQSLLLHRKG